MEVGREVSRLSKGCGLSGGVESPQACVTVPPPMVEADVGELKQAKVVC